MLQVLQPRLIRFYSNRKGKIYMNSVMKTTEQIEIHYNSYNIKNLLYAIDVIAASNKILREQSSQSIKELSWGSKKETVNSVLDALNIGIRKLNSTAQEISKYENIIAKEMNSNLKSFEKAKHKFFLFDNFRTFLFWVGCGGNFITLVLLAYFLFFMG